jgi:hypothetical protein
MLDLNRGRCGFCIARNPDEDSDAANGIGNSVSLGTYWVLLKPFWVLLSKVGRRPSSAARALLSAEISRGGRLRYFVKGRELGRFYTRSW